LGFPYRFQQRRTRIEPRRGGRIPAVRHRRPEHRPSQIAVLLSDNVEIPRHQHRANREYPTRKAPPVIIP